MMTFFFGGGGEKDWRFLKPSLSSASWDIDHPTGILYLDDQFDIVWLLGVTGANHKHTKWMYMYTTPWLEDIFYTGYFRDISYFQLNIQRWRYLDEFHRDVTCERQPHCFFLLGDVDTYCWWKSWYAEFSIVHRVSSIEKRCQKKIQQFSPIPESFW